MKTLTLVLAFVAIAAAQKAPKAAKAKQQSNFVAHSGERDTSATSPVESVQNHGGFGGEGAQAQGGHYSQGAQHNPQQGGHYGGAGGQFGAGGGQVQHNIPFTGTFSNHNSFEIGSAFQGGDAGAGSPQAYSGGADSGQYQGHGADSGQYQGHAADSGQYQGHGAYSGNGAAQYSGASLGGGQHGQSFASIGPLGGSGSQGVSFDNFQQSLGSEAYNGPLFSNVNPYQGAAGQAVNAGFDLGNGGRFSLQFAPGQAQEYEVPVQGGNSLQGNHFSGAQGHQGHHGGGASSYSSGAEGVQGRY